MKRMKEEMMMSGDDSPLKSVWEEICVQVQGEESIYWEVAYLPTIHQVVSHEVKSLDETTKRAIWLQTNEGDEWAAEVESLDREPSIDLMPVDDLGVATHIVEKFVLNAAADYTNARIERFNEREHDR